MDSGPNKTFGRYLPGELKRPPNRRDECNLPGKPERRGLTLAGIYQFQIRALGLLGYTDWMDPKTFVVA
jgi:hypothetical protein